jgi:hypothetical protein
MKPRRKSVGVIKFRIKNDVNKRRRIRVFPLFSLIELIENSREFAEKNRKKIDRKIEMKRKRRKKRKK